MDTILIALAIAVTFWYLYWKLAGYITKHVERRDWLLDSWIRRLIG